MSKYAHWAPLGGGIELAGAQRRGVSMNSQHIYLSTLMEVFSFNSIADLGCAAGHWLREAIQLGIEDIGGV